MSKLSLRGSKWRALREKMLRQAGYRCSRCARPGRLEVDHIVPLAQGGAPYDESNLQVLCKACHHIKGGFPIGKHVKEREEWGRFINELMR